MTERSTTQVGIIGAGPAGLLLSHLLALRGIESIVVEARSRAYCEARQRAGLLEAGTVELLRAAGLGQRLDAEGLEHGGIYLQFAGERHHIDFRDLTGGRWVTVYAQTEIVKDLIGARLAAGGQIEFEVSDVGLGDLDGDRPVLRYTDSAGTRHEVRSQAIAGCDGSHGISRDCLPPGLLTVAGRDYPYAWLGILAAVPPSTDELIYARHESGFSLHSMRSPQVSRLYLQVPADTDIERWPDDRIWRELQRRLGLPGWDLKEGPITEKGVSLMRSFVASPMRFGRLFLAGDAAHIVPPTGAKGLNLAIADVTELAAALVSLLRDGRTEPADEYSDTCLRRVWRAEHFSWWMTSMLHVDPHPDPFGAELQLAQLRYVTSSRAAATTLAENYTGYYPLRWPEQGLPQARVVPRAQRPGQQGGQRRGDPGVGQRQRRGDTALAQQGKCPQPVPERVKLGAHGVGQPGATARRPALHAVDGGQQPGQLVVSGEAAGQDHQQRGLAHGDGEVRLRAVIGPDQRGGADMPPRGRVRRHQLAGLGEHQPGAAAADRAHLALCHAAQGVQREHVQFLAQGPDKLVAPPERVHRLGDQWRRDVVPGGEPQPLGGVTEQPAQRGQRVIGECRRREQARDQRAGQPRPLPWPAMRPGVDALGADPAQPGVRTRRAPRQPLQVGASRGLASGEPAIDEAGPLGAPAAGAGAQLSGGKGEFERGRARVVGGALLRSHDRAPGEQVGIRRCRVGGLDRLGVGGDALLVPARVGRDDLLGPGRGAYPGIAVQSRQAEQAAERLRHADPAGRGHRPLDRQRVPEELLQPQQRDRFQALIAGQPGEGCLRVTSSLGILARQGFQRLALCHHADSLPQPDARG
ncbi:MAG: 4-hydroxybenzoate 3-monooxygenase [Streptosporangiaceae bacterium]|nr:4-hydroxybenzoate 3-monooxygenase [Streptosporangiaceae bacterium]